MIKIHSNHNKKDMKYSFSAGQAFPNIEGKLLSVEVNGPELKKLVDSKEIPLYDVEYVYLAWHGKQAGGVLKILRELFDK